MEKEIKIFLFSINLSNLLKPWAIYLHVYDFLHQECLIFSCRGITSASFNLSGKIADSKDVFISLEIELDNSDSDNFNIFEDIQFFPVAF